MEGGRGRGGGARPNTTCSSTTTPTIRNKSTNNDTHPHAPHNQHTKQSRVTRNRVRHTCSRHCLTPNGRQEYTGQSKTNGNDDDNTPRASEKTFNAFTRDKKGRAVNTTQCTTMARLPLDLRLRAEDAGLLSDVSAWVLPMLSVCMCAHGRRSCSPSIHDARQGTRSRGEGGQHLSAQSSTSCIFALEKVEAKTCDNVWVQTRIALNMSRHAKHTFRLQSISATSAHFRPDKRKIIRQSIAARH